MLAKGFDTVSSSVGKFNSAPQPPGQPDQPSQQLPPTASVDTQAPSAAPEPQHAPAAPTIQAVQPITQPAPPAVPVQQSSQPGVGNPNYQQAVTAVEDKINQLSTLPTAAQTPIGTETAAPQQPSSAPVPVAVSANAATSTQTAPLNQGPMAPTAPVMSVDPISIQQQPAVDSRPAQANTMPGSSAMMTLDKNEPGVFSDEELHELSNTNIEGPVPPAGLTTERTAFVPTQQQLQQQSSPQISNTMPGLNPSTQPGAGLPQGLQVDKLKAEKPKSSKVLKPLGVAASILLVFLAGYYLWRTNYPSLAFKIASSKAGISATMPGYVPDGFELNGNIQSSPGSVSYNLQNPGSRKIQITQSKTDWDSQALAENYISPKADNYIALQAQGLTIYMMGSSQANWVNKGTWYRIESPSNSLTQEQVIKMATSL